MELLKKNIHMNKLKCKSNVQLTLDDDFNVPDVKPDALQIIKEQGSIIIQDVKAMNGKAMVKGALKFNLLYISEDDLRPIHNITGEIPFDEMVNMDQACAEDNVTVKWNLDDLTTSLINSRKISVKSIVNFVFTAEDIYDEETGVSVEGEYDIKCKNKKIDITQIVLNKKDTFRIKDEITLPSGKPNMFELLYDEVELRNVETRMGENKIDISGNVQLFALYVGEDEEKRLQYFDTELPFNGTVDCNGCSNSMISDLEVSILHKGLEIKPDLDGEERILDMEVVLNLEIKAYEEESLEILSDIYATVKELVPTIKDAYYENLLIKNNNKARIIDRIKITPGELKVLQICNATGTIRLDELQVIKDGIQADGVIEVQVLYITEDDNRPIASTKGVIPFSQIIEVKGMRENSVYDVKPSMEQISVMMLDGEEIEVKAGINLDTIVFDKIIEPIIIDLKEEELDMIKLQEMPGIVGYIVKQGDTLWQIAKNFYTTVESIMELNDLSDEEVSPGNKLLLMKQV